MDPSQNPMLAMGIAAQGQNVGQQPNGANTPLGATADPRSQYLAMALAQANKSGQNSGNAMGLGGNLLAAALDRYGMNQQATQQGANGYYVNAQGQSVPNPGGIPGGSAGGTYVPPQTPVPF